MDESTPVSSEVLARDVLENLLEGCQVIAPDWTYLYVNPAAARQAQRAPAELVGRTMMACFPGIEQTAMFAKLRHCMTARIHDRMENEFTFPDGSTGWFQLRFIPVPEGVCILSLDVTESRRTAAALLRTEGQLRQIQKMEAIGRLAGGVAHDFNNLLSIILGYASLGLEGDRAPEPWRESFAEIQRAAERGAGLTRQLLTFSRRQTFAPRVVDLNEVVRGVEPMLRRLVSEAIEIRVVLDPALGRTHADPGQLEQVLVNLVVNARDAMPAGGALVIETKNVTLDPAYAAEHLGVAAGPYLMVAVSDTGIGMDRATQARIFEPFFTTKETGHGTGLGLATVFGIVRQSHGSVWVYSEPGHGSTFKVYLPRTDAPVEEAPDLVAPARLGGTESVLLVEDDEQLRALTARILQIGGYRVHAAPDGRAALALFERLAEPADLLLTDVVMPGLGGPELAEQLVRRLPELRVIFMSGYTADAMASARARAGGATLLEKPIAPDTLLRRVRAVLDTPRES